MPLEALVKNIYSPSSDIFSFGVIFYELMTGITPWECKNEKELIKKMNSLPYCLSERFKISTANRELLERLCSLDAEKRLAKE
jgi:serine/threonine protein kinase